MCKFCDFFIIDMFIGWMLFWVLVGFEFGVIFGKWLFFWISCVVVKVLCDSGKDWVMIVGKMLEWFGLVVLVLMFDVYVLESKIDYNIFVEWLIVFIYVMGKIELFGFFVDEFDFVVIFKCYENVIELVFIEDYKWEIEGWVKYL